MNRDLLTGLAACAFALCALCTHAAHAAEPASTSIDDVIGRFDIQRYEVSGNTLLDAGMVEKLLAGFAGKQRDFGDVERAMDALQDAYAALGFSVVRVVLPEQVLNNGVVRLQVVEARVGKVTVEGNTAFDEANIRRSLPALREGEIPNIARISSSLRVANENPAKKTNLSMQSGERDAEVDIALQVADEKPWALSLLLSNSGSERTGRTNVTTQYQHFNVGGLDHTLSAQYTTTMEHPDSMSVFGGAYHVPLYGLGDSLDFFATYSEVDSGKFVAGPFNLLVSGKGTVLGGRYNYALPRRGDYNSKVVAGIDHKAFVDSIDLAGIQLGNDVTLHPLSLSYAGDFGRPDGVSSFALTLVHNLPGGDKGREADLQRVRFGAEGGYSILRYSGSHLLPFAGDWQARASLSGQATRDALVPGEQFSAGGATTVRGFGERVLAGDQGHTATAELYTPELCAGLFDGTQCRVLAFFDMGRASRNHALPGERLKNSASGAGLGLRFAVGRSLSLQMDLGQVLDNADSPARRGQHHMHVSMSLAF